MLQRGCHAECAAAPGADHSARPSGAARQSAPRSAEAPRAAPRTAAGAARDPEASGCAAASAPAADVRGESRLRAPQAQEVSRALFLSRVASVASDLQPACLTFSEYAPDSAFRDCYSHFSYVTATCSLTLALSRKGRKGGRVPLPMVTVAGARQSLPTV